MMVAVVADEPSLSFERFFLDEYARVVAIARRIVGDWAAAEDVAQDVFAKAADDLRFKQPGAHGWLYGAAVHTALNELRSRRRRGNREFRLVRLSAGLTAVAEHESDPQRALDREEMRALVRRAMLRLSERSAALLALRYGGLSYREIAQALRLDEAQIGTLLARAQSAFRKEIENVETV
jgi:RNA polymerase sigma-70 factor (ECF subfamily)